MTLSTKYSVHAGRQRRLNHASHVFFRVVISVILLSFIVFIFSDRHGSRAKSSLSKRDSSSGHDSECHLVHNVVDQCSFVRANCGDEEPGYIPYLQFYYCTLPHTKPVAFTVVVLWLGLLFSTIGLAASDFFCVNLGSIATMAGLSENFAGVTLLALGNGSPDVFSTFAAMYNHSGSLAIGELIGAAGFITAVVAGSMAFIRPFKVPRKAFMRDVIFFIIAAAFSLGFLADGKLYLWECVVMVLLYVFYVCLVVGWHWYFRRQKRRRQLEEAARSHFSFHETDAADANEQYHDDEEDRDPREQTPSRHGTEDFYALEREALEGDDDEEEYRERYRGEISSRMRLRRPRQSDRRHTHDPIRPSLLGALEFRSVLSGLHREGNLQAYPLHPRRYSDDPTLILTDQRSTKSLPNQAHEHLQPHHHPALHHTPSGTRARATSAIEPGVYANRLTQTAPRIEVLIHVEDEETNQPQSPTHGRSQSHFHPPPSPTISITPPASEHILESSAATPVVQPQNRTGLAPPGATRSKSTTTEISLSGSQISPGTTTAQFPTYTDDSFPSSPITSPIQNPYFPTAPAAQNSTVHEQSSRPLSWWPYWLLATPEALLSSLFPTLYLWREKGFWGRLFGLLSAPSVFLLTVTLPVVEMVNDEGEDSIPELSLPQTGGSSQVLSQAGGITTGSVTPSTQPRTRSQVQTNEPSVNILATGATRAEDLAITRSPDQLPLFQAESENTDWNRWLIMIQLFTAPLFCILIVWANMDYGNRQLLLHMSLGSLAFSCFALGFIIWKTKADRAPKWHGLFCILGFCVSIAWISTIAGEVVGVLKALGIIFNISDAVLGLTVFAVGNSLGDLVADVTMAKLGFPVMALSACFGGPMLNILLGIGISGAYMTIKGAQKRHSKHPEKRFKFKPYVVEVDRTLMISGIALLVTLVGLLIAVPLRKWKMDRFIGWVLIGLWLLATIGNLGTELLMPNEHLTTHK